MKTDDYHPWVFRVAVLTVCVAMLPIIAGGLVTTMQAGMAFPDWPSSDGHGMLSYPWLQSTGDKFLEHGHRLAAMLVGCVSILLAIVLWTKESRRWVRWCGVAVLLCVIAQGVLGGQRVLLNELGLAFLHGSFANLVFALMAAVALFTSRGWLAAREKTAPANLSRVTKLAAASTIVLFIQYVLGGLLRHLGWWPHQHLGFAFVVLIVVSLTVFAARADKKSWIWKPAHWLSILLVLQIALGLGTWVTKFGFGSYVAVAGSLPQIWLRTSHFVVGLLTFAVAVILLLRALRLTYVARHTERRTGDVSSSPLVTLPDYGLSTGGIR